MQIFAQNAMSEMDNEIQWEQTNEVQLLFRENGPVCVCGKWKSKLLLHSFVRRVYAPQFFVSSQQRFGAMDIKARGASVRAQENNECQDNQQTI